MPPPVILANSFGYSRRFNERNLEHYWYPLWLHVLRDQILANIQGLIVAPQFTLWVKKTGPAKFLEGRAIGVLHLHDDSGTEDSEDGDDINAEALHVNGDEDTGDESEVLVTVGHEMRPQDEKEEIYVGSVHDGNVNEEEEENQNDNILEGLEEFGFANLSTSTTKTAAVKDSLWSPISRLSSWKPQVIFQAIR